MSVAVFIFCPSSQAVKSKSSLLFTTPSFLHLSNSPVTIAECFAFRYNIEYIYLHYNSFWCFCFFFLIYQSQFIYHEISQSGNHCFIFCFSASKKLFPSIPRNCNFFKFFISVGKLVN